METFTEADFAVGREVQINGAQFLIYGCDEFTRDYYTKVHPSHTPLPHPPPRSTGYAAPPRVPYSANYGRRAAALTDTRSPPSCWTPPSGKGG